MRAINSMETIYEEAVSLSDMAEVLKESIYQHNPAIDSTDKISLAVLAADAKILARRFKDLKVNIIKEHEKAQLTQLKGK